MAAAVDNGLDLKRVRSTRGFIVVAVLWILAALSALVLIYLTYVTNTAVIVAGSTDRILAWRAPTELGDGDPENSFYKTSGVSYLPRHAPFPAAEELWLVYGIPSAVIGRMLPFVTVFSNMAAINVLDAAPQVLAALPGMTPENLQSLLAQRSDPSVDPHTLIGLSGGEGATLASSKAYRISVDVELPDGQRRGGEVVILLLENSDEPYRVLSWRNSSDGSTTPQKVSSR